MGSAVVSRTIRVLVVDDSASARQLLCRELARHEGIEVVGTATDAYTARDQIVALSPDVLTLDIRMPRMDGVTFLRKLMKHHPMPVVVISTMGAAGGPQAIEALSAGAVDVVCKPTAGEVESFSAMLAEKIHAASNARVHSTIQPHHPHHSTRQSRNTDAIFAIGASTGGVQAITEIISSLPADIPPTLIVQHMPPGFTASFAQRLNGLGNAIVKEAAEGDAVIPGRALIAPGGFHMILKRRGGGLIVELTEDAEKFHQRPSIDVMFDSIAEIAGEKTIGALLTGMGVDGAEGLLNLRRAGAQTIAQDEKSSTVFGMPAEAIKLGAAEVVLPLGRIPQAMMSRMGSKRAKV